MYFTRVTYGSRTRLAGFTVLRLPATAKATMQVQRQLHIWQVAAE